LSEFASRPGVLSARAIETLLAGRGSGRIVLEDGRAPRLSDQVSSGPGNPAAHRQASQKHLTQADTIAPGELWNTTEGYSHDLDYIEGSLTVGDVVTDVPAIGAAVAWTPFPWNLAVVPAVVADRLEDNVEVDRTHTYTHYQYENGDTTVYDNGTTVNDFRENGTRVQTTTVAHTEDGNTPRDIEVIITRPGEPPVRYLGALSPTGFPILELAPPGPFDQPVIRDAGTDTTPTTVNGAERGEWAGARDEDGTPINSLAAAAEADSDAARADLAPERTGEPARASRPVSRRDDSFGGNDHDSHVSDSGQNSNSDTDGIGP